MVDELDEKSKGKINKAFQKILEMHALDSSNNDQSTKNIFCGFLIFFKTNLKYKTTTFLRPLIKGDMKWLKEVS